MTIWDTFVNIYKHNSFFSYVIYVKMMYGNEFVTEEFEEVMFIWCWYDDNDDSFVEYVWQIIKISL